MGKWPFGGFLKSKVIYMLNKIITFLKEVRVELKKVNWPTREETTKYTAIVIGLSLAVAIYLGAFDWFFTFLVQSFILR